MTDATIIISEPVQDTLKRQFKTRRFKYKFHMIIWDDYGKVIKDKKYCTAHECAEDNLDLLRNRQVVSRIANKYQFSNNFHAYDNVTIDKINEKRKTKFIYSRVLDED